MSSNIFILLRQELLLSLLIFILLFIKIGKERSNESVLNLINGLLVVNLAAGLFGMSEGGIFNGMFTTNAFIVLEKNILNLALLIIGILIIGLAPFLINQLIMPSTDFLMINIDKAITLK